MGTKRGVYSKSLSQIILLALEKSVDGYVRLEDFMYKPGYYARGYERDLKKSRLAEALKQLRERGFVKEDKIDAGKLILKLTDSGRETLGLDQIEEKKWDGKFRIVIFDIPEQKRILRNMFRRVLKKWGFKQLQKSVWVSKLDVYDRLVNYIHELGIDEWVSVIEANKLSGKKW